MGPEHRHSIVMYSICYVYGPECRALNKEEKMKMKVAETRTSRQWCGMIRLDRIENECVKGSLEATNIVGKMRE